MKWQYNGQDVTFPFVPEVAGDYTFTAVWETWIYTVNYMIPTSDTDSTLVLHATQQVTFGDNLGAFLTENTTGSNMPVVIGLQFFSKWKLEDGTLVTSSYIPNQDANTYGNVIELIGEFFNTQGLALTYDAVKDVYNVTGFSLSTTARPNGSVNLFIPATSNNGINGIKPINNVRLYSNNATMINKFGSVTIEENDLTDREIISGSNFKYLTSFTIPLGFTSLGNNCFKDFTSLTSITIPSSVTSIGAICFYSCTSLTSITIPSSVTSIGMNSFIGCTSLTSITWLRDNLSSDFFSKNVFNTGAQTTFTFGTTQNQIKLFYDNKAIMSYDEKTIYVFPSISGVVDLTTLIPSSVTSLGNFCFRSSTSLTSITIPSSVTSLGSSCFNGCTSLTSITLSSNITSLGTSCFHSCTSLTSITIPSGVTSLASNCFQNSGLTSITIPSSVTSLEGACFSDCKSLTSVTMQGNVTSLESYCFNGCSSLTSIQFLLQLPQ